MTGWRDIEKDPPPKDGTMVLLFFAESVGGPYLGWFDNEPSYPWVFIDSTDAAECDACQLNRDYLVEPNGAPEAWVTHWQPLPEPPQ